MRSQLPGQVLNPHPLCWKLKFQPVEVNHQGSASRSIINHEMVALPPEKKGIIKESFKIAG